MLASRRLMRRQARAEVDSEGDLSDPHECRSLLSSGCGSDRSRFELLERPDDALAPKTAGDRADEPAEHWRKAAAETQRLGFDVQTISRLREGGEDIRPPQVAAIASSRQKHFIGSAGALHLANLFGVGYRERMCVVDKHVAHG